MSVSEVTCTVSYLSVNGETFHFSVYIVIVLYTECVYSSN